MVQARDFEAAPGPRLASALGRLRPRRLRMPPRRGGFVGILKLGLPGIAVALIGLVVIWPHLYPAAGPIPLASTNISREELETSSMINTRYTGVDGRNQPFAVTAETANELNREAGLVELIRPKADITIESGAWVALMADTGIFARKDQVIDLAGNVNLFHDAGYEFRTKSAHVDLSTSIAHGFEPVWGQGPFGTIRSEGFRILERGTRVIFTGRSNLVLNSGFRGSAQ